MLDVVASPSLLALVAVAGVVATVASLVRRYRWFLSVPGPMMPKAVCGDLMDVAQQHNQFGRNKVRQHGFVYRVWVWLSPVLVLADPEACEDFYRGTGIHKRPWALGLGSFFERYLGQCMGCLDGRDWTRVRKAFRPSLSSQQADRSGAIVAEALDAWEEAALKPRAQKGEAVRVLDVVGNMPLEVVLCIFFGRAFVTAHAAEVASLRQRSAFLMKTIFGSLHAGMPWFQWLPTEENRQLRAFQTEWERFLTAYECSEERNSGNGGAFEHVLAACSEMSREELTQTMAEVIFANQDVAVPAFTWLFAHLAAYPELQRALGDRCLQVVEGKEGKEGKAAAVIETKAQLEGEFADLLNFINESARTAPVFPLSMQEILGTTTSIGGHTIPAGTKVCVDLYSLNSNPNHWAKPDVFDPERFASLPEYTRRWGFHRFGLGARKCPGQFFANLAMSNAVLRVLTKYEIVPAAPAKIASHHDIPTVAGMPFIAPDLEVFVRPRPAYVRTSPVHLAEKPVYVGVSVMPSSPILSPDGARQMVRFLSTLPNPALVMIVDGLTRHNIAAFEHRPMDKCLELAVQRGDEFHRILSDEIQALPEAARDRVTLLRWADIETEQYARMVEVCNKHYNDNEAFRAKIDDIANGFLSYRQPNASESSRKKRLPHVVQYVLGEVPVLVVGAVNPATAQHHGLLVYPGCTRHIKAMTDKSRSGTLHNLISEIHSNPQLAALRAELIQCSGGNEAVTGFVGVVL